MDSDLIVEDYLAKKQVYSHDGDAIAYVTERWVISGTFSEYLDFTKRMAIKNPDENVEYKFVRLGDPNEFVRSKTMRGYFVGTWESREDIETLKAIIKHRRQQEKDMLR